MEELLRVKTTDCSSEKLCRLAVQAGFVVKEGKKHCKVRTREGVFITTIPRHPRIKRETVRGIVRAFAAHGAKLIAE